jgi:methylmalonyl-CoA mutase N-terminal domain/subunit
VPNWNTISISGYHIREAGSTAVQEVAFTLATASRVRQRALDAGLDVDDFAPRLSFFFNAHNDFLEEIAKFRAARRLWAASCASASARPTRARAAAALPHADRRQHADRAAARQQRRARDAAGAGGGARRHAVAAHQRPDEALALPTEESRRGSRCARSRSSRTMPLIVEAVEVYATLGEISGTLARVFGEHRE